MLREQNELKKKAQRDGKKPTHKGYGCIMIPFQ